MKKEFLYRIALVLSFSLVVSCSTDDDNNSTNNSVQIAQVENIAETGTWRVTNFNDSGQDETNDFNGYVFTFSSNGILTATNGTTSYTGTWSVTGDDSSDDDGSSGNDDLDFNISFPVPDTDDFADLNDDWDIVSYSDTTINLIDVSGGNGETDLLTFQRN